MKARTLLSILLLMALIIPVLPRPVVFGQYTDGMIDNFEPDSFRYRWWHYTNESVFTCTRAQGGYNSSYALQMTFALEANQYPGCGMHIETAVPWAASSGLSFVWRSSQPGLSIGVVVSLDDPTQTNPDAQGLTPFERFVQAPGDQWTEVTLTWDTFDKAGWVGANGITTLNLAQAAELVFSMDDLQTGSIWIDDVRLILDAAQQPSPTPEGIAPLEGFDKFSLWTNGTALRGANIWQRLVFPYIDGSSFLGGGPVGPPYTQADFDRLAALGANFVNISGPGLFTENPPYELDKAVQDNLDNLLAMIEQANMFAVISIRTGPGRSDFTFYDKNIEEWGDPALVNDNVWVDQAAQDAWVAMWRHIAERYHDNPIVVGYDLMVEPNGPDRLLDIYSPAQFYPAYAGTLYDWNQLYPRLVAAIREVDPDTPILVSAMGWGALNWLPYLQLSNDPRVVYTVHQYQPHGQYTHQDPPAENSYPGSFDLDDDGVPDPFDRAWLDHYLSSIDTFKAQHGVPVAVNEFGVMRWVPGAAVFMRDQMELFEMRGMNYAFWVFNPAWEPHQTNDSFDFLHGSDPNTHSNVETSDLIQVVRRLWSRNTLRPSMVEP